TSSTSTPAPTHGSSSTSSCARASSSGRSRASARRPRFASPSERPTRTRSSPTRSLDCATAWQPRADDLGWDAVEVRIDRCYLGRSVPRVSSRPLDLFGRASSFRSLFLAALASGIGTWLAFVALTIDVWDRTHSGSWVSALLIADFLPTIVVGLVLAPVVDRVSRRGLMISADLFRFGVFCALPFSRNATTIVVLAGLAGAATAFFRPAVYAGLPNLVWDDDLPRANSLLQTAENVTTTFGPVAGGLLVAATNPHSAYWINAVTFLLSAALIARIPARTLQTARSLSEGHFRDIVAGLRLILRARPLLTVLVVWNLV